MESSVEIFAIVHLLILGASHAFRPRFWAEFFVRLSEMGRTGVFLHSFMSLWFGSIVVGFHPSWAGIPALLTGFGWLLLCKAAFGFVFPDLALRSLQRVSVDAAWKFILPGVLYLILAGLLGFHLWKSP